MLRLELQTDWVKPFVAYKATCRCWCVVCLNVLRGPVQYLHLPPDVSNCTTVHIIRKYTVIEREKERDRVATRGQICAISNSWTTYKSCFAHCRTRLKTQTAMATCYRSVNGCHYTYFIYIYQLLKQNFNKSSIRFIYHNNTPNPVTFSW